MKLFGVDNLFPSSINFFNFFSFPIVLISIKGNLILRKILLISLSKASSVFDNIFKL